MLQVAGLSPFAAVNEQPSKKQSGDVRDYVQEEYLVGQIEVAGTLGIIARHSFEVI